MVIPTGLLERGVRARNVTMAVLSVSAIAKIVSLFLPVFSAKGQVLDTDLAMFDVAPLTVGILVSVMLDVIAVVMVWRGSPWPLWMAFLMACGGALTFALGVALGDFIAGLVSVGPVNEYQNLEVGIAVFVLFIVYSVEVVSLPISGLILMKAPKTAGVSWEARGDSDEVPVIRSEPACSASMQPVNTNRMPASLSIFDEEN